MASDPDGRLFAAEGTEKMSADDLLGQLRALVGVEAPTQVARHPVNAPAIADWCDAIGDGNPCYTDEDFARKSRHGGLVAPPATLDIWDRPGLPAQDPQRRRRADDPRARMLQLLEAHGYVGVAATNSDLEIRRYLRPGDVLHNTMVVEDISPEKQTALGLGHFLTMRHRFTTADGEHVGDLYWRILKFKPGTGTTKSDTSSRPAPDPSPELRPRPSINRDNQALWDGYRMHELRVPRCNGCGRVFFPPSPRCAQCGGFDIGCVAASGRGWLYSFTVVHHPQVPGFRYPLHVGVVELADHPGVRIVSDIVGCRGEDLQVGMPLEVEWLDSHPALEEGATDARGPVTLPLFRPATPERERETRAARDVAEGQRLPVWTLPVTPTLIVSGALATRDFQDVHHDRDLAVRQGSKDIFLNINTSLGLMQRFVTDWAGPEAVVTALRVRLGAPAYPYLHLSFTGSVQAIDTDTGRVVVGVQASNDLGPHITGTVELELAP